MGAAVLARTSCQSGIQRLQSGRDGPLYFANGLLLMGHGESVETLRVTTSRRHLRLSGKRFVSSPNVFFSSSANGCDSYRCRSRKRMNDLSNIAGPVLM